MNKRDKSIWEEYFDAHAPDYMDNSFTRATKDEVNFIIEELGLPGGNSILDVGCGTGRHSIELAKRGYIMTGVDISSGMLEEARKAAEVAGVGLNLVKSDAVQMVFDHKFDAAVCLCEGAFALLGESDDAYDHDMRILNNIAVALKPGAPFILETLNGLQKARHFNNDDVKNRKFDPLTLVETFTMELETPEGKRVFTLRERGYIASELILMMELNGFSVKHVWGGTAGNWRREIPDMDEIGILLVAHKTGGE
ncbi:MAG: class I SAM-dependent methyltransferase [Candidatus Zixiibacteriota bacterium]|nr:MAG: class I SAM-dependent methyltransferase [candidate division Zixibacteria bacterium]